MVNRYEQEGMFLQQKVEQLIENSSGSISSMGKHILAHPDEVGGMTMEAIAQNAYTSKATAIRFVKKLGYASWRDFVRDWTVEQSYRHRHEQDRDVNLPFGPEDSMENMMESLMQIQSQSMADTVEVNASENLEKAVEMMLQARQVVVFARAPNTYLASIFTRSLMTIGLHASCAIPHEMGLTARNMTEQDCALVVSYNGNEPDRDPLRCVPMLKNNQVPFIGIAAMGDCWLRRQADLTLNLSGKEHICEKLGSFASMQSLQFLFNTLYAGIFSRSYDQALQIRKNHSICLEQERRTLNQNRQL